MVDIVTGGRLRGVLTGLAGRLGASPLFARRYAPTMRDYGLRNSRFEDNPLTGDRRRFQRMHGYIAADPRLALGGPTMGWLKATLASSATLNDDAYAAGIRTPVLAFSATADRVVCTQTQDRLCRDKMPDCRLVHIEDANHEILMERDPQRKKFWQAFDAFMGSERQDNEL